MRRSGMKEIVNRTTRTSAVLTKTRWGDVQRIKKTVIRELACGHEQVEPNGGAAKKAAEAYCKPCIEAEKAPKL